MHDYLNDVLCLPLFLPIILRVQSLLGLRRYDFPPTLFEVLQNWVVFSILYEVILPRISVFDSTGDPWDVAAYLLGGLVAFTWWNRSRTALKELRTE